MKRKILSSPIVQWFIGLIHPVSIKMTDPGYDYLMKSIHCGHHYTFEDIKFIFDTKAFLKQVMWVKYKDPFGRTVEDVVYFNNFWREDKANKKMIEIKKAYLKLNGLCWVELILPAKEKITMILIIPRKDNEMHKALIIKLKNRTGKEQKVTLFKP